LTIVEVDPTSKKLPSPPDSVAAVFAACGKVKSVAQIPLAETATPAAALQAARPSPEIARAVDAVVRDYRARFVEIVDRAALPHDLPPTLEALTTTGLGETTGPK